MFNSDSESDFLFISPIEIDKEDECFYNLENRTLLAIKRGDVFRYVNWEAGVSGLIGIKGFLEYFLSLETSHV